MEGQGVPRGGPMTTPPSAAMPPFHDRRIRGIVVCDRQPVYVIGAKAESQREQKSLRWKLLRVAIGAGIGTDAPKNFVGGAVFETQLRRISMNMTAEAEDPRRNRRASFPVRLGMASRNIEIVPARGRSDVEIKRPDREIADERVARRKRKMHAHMHALICAIDRLEHCAHEKCVAFARVVTDQSRQFHCIGFRTGSGDPQHDAAEQLTALRGNDVDVMKNFLRNRLAVLIHEVHAIARAANPARRHERPERRRLGHRHRSALRRNLHGADVDDELSVRPSTP